jgi:homoserine kinase type II
MTVPAAVLDRYPPTRRGTQSVTRLAGGATTAPWLITSSAGRHVLRELPGYLAAPRAQLAAAVHAHAAHTLAVVPQAIANDAGDLITQHAGARYMLTRYAPGHPLPPHAPPLGLCRQLGEVLGQLHQRLRQLPAHSATPRQRIPADPAAGILAAAAQHTHPHCQHRDARRVLAAKLRRARALRPQDLAVLRALPATPIHGDFHPGNVLTIDDRVSGVLDFDLTRLAPPGYELMRALIYCTHPAGPPEIYAPRVSAFLTGYLTTSPLSAHELATMTALFETTQILDTYGLDQCVDADLGLLAFSQARFSLLYWLHRNARALTDLALRTHQPGPGNARGPSRLMITPAPGRRPAAWS